MEDTTEFVPSASQYDKEVQRTNDLVKLVIRLRNEFCEDDEFDQRANIKECNEALAPFGIEPMEQGK